MKKLVKFILPYLANLITRFPYNNTMSRILDKLLRYADV